MIPAEKINSRALIHGRALAHGSNHCLGDEPLNLYLAFANLSAEIG